MSMYCTVHAVAAQQADRLQAAKDEMECFQELENAAQMGVGQHWQGLHYLLTGSASLWTESGSEPPAPQAFLVVGGKELEDADGGYGPARLFSAQEVRAISSLFAEIDEKELSNRLDAAQNNPEQVYGFHWNVEPEIIRKMYRESFVQLKQFLNEAACSGQSLVVMLH